MTFLRASTVAVVFLSATALAAEVDVKLTTLVNVRPEASEGGVRTDVPIYEIVALRVRHLDTAAFQDIGVTADLWGALTFSGAAPVGPSGDIKLLFVDGYAFKKRLMLRAGRQYVVGGVNRHLFFDGGSADLKFGRGVGLSLYGGQPTTFRFSNYLKGEWVTGGRLYWSPTTDAQVGVSMIHAAKHSDVMRQDIGIDGRWRLFRKLTLTGFSAWSLADKRLSEIDVGPRWQPFSKLEIGATYRRTAPDLFLPRNSIFSVFADTSRDDLGLDLSYQLNRAVSFYGEGRVLWLNGEQGAEFALRSAVRVPSLKATTASLQLRRLALPSNGLYQGRLGARHVLPNGLGLAADFEAYSLDQAIRGKTLSLSGSATATWDFSPSWMAGVSFFGGSTPYFDSRYEVMAKLTYSFPGERRSL